MKAKMADTMDDRTIYRRAGKQAQHEGARILIAEDSPLHRALITIQLTMAGYVVEEVYNGIEAVSRIENSRKRLPFWRGWMSIL